MPRYIQKIWAGDVYEAKEYFSQRERGRRYDRSMRENISPEEMLEYNIAESRRKCGRMINANFTEGDLFLTLTFRERVDVKKGLRLFRNFIERLKRLRRRKGCAPLKYLYVIESEKKREHIHLVINRMETTLKELTDLWGLGRVLMSILEPGGDYTGLAYYITKENYKEYGKRWSGSRNLEKPKVEVKEINEEKKTQRLRVPKGYKLMEETEYYTEESGHTRYIKCLRIGGTDYGEGKPQQQYSAGEG